MNITHIINLLKAFFIEKKKKWLILFSILFGLTLFIHSIAPDAGIIKPVTIGLMIGIAASFFQHSLKRNNSVHFFNLPVTTGEKLMYSVLSLLILGVGIQILLFAGAYIGAFINPHLHINNLFFRPADNMLSWKQWLFLCSVMSIFLFGSIYFKKNAVWKTLGSWVGLSQIMSFYVLGLIYIASKVIFDANDKLYMSNSDNVKEFIISYSTSFQYYYIIPIAIIVLFLSLTYLRLRETEV